jgi:hypothetical protein
VPDFFSVFPATEMKLGTIVRPITMNAAAVEDFPLENLLHSLRLSPSGRNRRILRILLKPILADATIVSPRRISDQKQNKKLSAPPCLGEALRRGALTNIMDLVIVMYL